MRAGRWAVAAMLGVWVVSVAGQTPAQKISTPAEFDKVMKAVNQTNGQINKAIKSGAFTDAKAAVGMLKQHFEAAGTFWEFHKKDDVLKLNQDTLSKIDALDKVLAGAPTDTTAIESARSAMNMTCRACHKGNRTQDDAGNYIIRPGVIGG